MLKGWLGGKTQVQSKSLTAIEELAQIQDAMSAVTYIMVDDIDSAEKFLAKGTSPFHQLGVGVCMFMRATLGFEADIMREAADTLGQAENGAYEQQRRAHKDTNMYRSAIYPPGTEYAVCQAEAQLMSAVVGLLNETLTEALKSFYKLRKAYITLEGVMEAERKFLNERSSSSVNSAGPSRPTSKPGSAGSSTLRAPIAEPKKTSDDDDDEDDFVDAAEDPTGNSTPQEYMGHINIPVSQGGSIGLGQSKEVDISSSSAPGLPPGNSNPTQAVPEAIEDFEKLTLDELADPEREISNFTDHPIDEFIISGASFCFGILLLLISMVPPSFVSILKVVGFKGDKERGLRMLWQATKYHNIHGAMAGVVLMGFYNGFIGLCDILPSSGEGSIPKARCRALMTEMRKRYPKSHLWLIEEARLLAADKQLEQAVQFVQGMGESPFKQLEALGWFERSLTNMSMHDHKATALGFEKCVTLNNWNHGLYYYICAASYIELYRQNQTTDPKTAKEYASKANEYYAKVIPNTGKKKFMGRQLPFDVFMTRKMLKWENRAKEWGCDFVDAIGVSPLEEMIYFWNGHKRMRDDHLQVSLDSLAWSESAANPRWGKEDMDEKAVCAVLRAAALRNMGRTAEAKEILQTHVIVHDNVLFTGGLKDNWTAPVARYEMAANLWREADAGGQPAAQQDLLAQCKQWLETVSGWGSYDLDARIGLKVTAGKETLRRFGVIVQ